MISVWDFLAPCFQSGATRHLLPGSPPPEAFGLDSHEVWLSLQGIGDAGRLGAIVKRQLSPGKRVVLVVASFGPHPGGAEISSQLSFVDAVVQWPYDTRDHPATTRWLQRHFPGCAEAWLPALREINPGGGLLSLDPTDLRDHTPSRSPYIVYQPATGYWKQRVFASPQVTRWLDRSGLPVHLVGSVEDKSLSVQFPLRWHDQRGALDLPAALRLVAGSSLALGVESWVAVTAGIFGVPAVMVCERPFCVNAGPAWQAACPSLRFVDLSSPLLALQVIQALSAVAS